MARHKRTDEPFHTDLNGYERVNKAVARKFWAHGMPIWIRTPDGLKLVTKPDEDLPAANTTPGFHKACQEQYPDVWKHYPWRDAKFYTIFGTGLSLHFTFKNGSNPYLQYGSVHQLWPVINQWSQHYKIRPIPSSSEDICCFELEERHSKKDLFPPQN